MNESLEELRKQWEVGLIPVAAFSTKSSNVVIILGNEKNDSLTDAKKTYRVHRYFPIGNNWNVSVDLVESSFQLMMIWILQHLLPKEI